MYSFTFESKVEYNPDIPAYVIIISAVSYQDAYDLLCAINSMGWKWELKNTLILDENYNKQNKGNPYTTYKNF